MSGQTGGDKEKIWEKNKSSFNAFLRKRTSEYYDPCQEAANRSMRCLKRNPDDRSLCQDFFDAYKDCKREWIHQMRSEPKSKSWLS